MADSKSEDKPQSVSYRSLNASGFSCVLVDEDRRERIQFGENIFTTDDPWVVKMMDAGIANLSLSRHVQEVDKSAAEKMAREHIARMQATGAHRGQTSSASTAALAALQARDQELHKMPDPDAVAKDIQENNDMLITEGTTPAKGGVKLGGKGDK